MSPFIKQCMSTWRKVMPDYELILWNEDRFDVNSVPFVKEAYDSKKYAFVSDYVRLYALYTEGGIYLDTDVKILRRFDEFLKFSFFTSQEHHSELIEDGMFDSEWNRLRDDAVGVGLHSAVLGAEPGIEYLGDCLRYYQDLHFDIERKDDFIIVNIIAKCLEKYGYRYILDQQYLETSNIMIFEPFVFSGSKDFDKDKTYALHLFNGSWTDYAGSLKNRMRNRFPRLYDVVKKIVKFRR